MLIPFRYTSQSNLPDSNVAAVERKENERIEREREREIPSSKRRTLNHYEIINVFIPRIRGESQGDRGRGGGEERDRRKR